MKDILLVFNHGQEPAKAIRQALSKALVPYYPLAGVFVVSHQEELQVLCNGDGVWFVEAVADCTLEDLHFLTDFPLIINQNDLLPQPLPGTDPTDRMLMMQSSKLVNEPLHELVKMIKDAKNRLPVDYFGVD
ncbi:hypothetical protein J5N97_020415 [Dioscorea zingiberensis]|uniref:Uncharacterized protein n=1 Tax=Dioscorea zingiberensis TaxID=325984 RepID=A0A9D5CFS3_9LILI|nr:hypothetical protein J5N97_020415 [Dioscorea zingiberensis]